MEKKGALWADYGAILSSVLDAYSEDRISRNGMKVCYKGMETVTATFLIVYLGQIQNGSQVALLSTGMPALNSTLLGGLHKKIGTISAIPPIVF